MATTASAINTILALGTWTSPYVLTTGSQWPIPVNCPLGTVLTVEAWGAGSGGSGRVSSTFGAAGGGGAYAQSQYTISPIDIANGNIPYTLGVGSAGKSGANPAAATSTSFSLSNLNLLPNTTNIGADVATQTYPAGYKVTGFSGSGLTTTLAGVGLDDEGWPCTDINYAGTAVGATSFGVLVFLTTGTDIPVTAGATYIYSQYVQVVAGDPSAILDINIVNDYDLNGSYSLTLNNFYEGPPSTTKTQYVTLPGNAPTGGTAGLGDAFMSFDVADGTVLNVTLRYSRGQFELGSVPTYWKPTPGYTLGAAGSHPSATTGGAGGTVANSFGSLLTFAGGNGAAYNASGSGGGGAAGKDGAGNTGTTTGSGGKGDGTVGGAGGAVKTTTPGTPGVSNVEGGGGGGALKTATTGVGGAGGFPGGGGGSAATAGTALGGTGANGQLRISFTPSQLLYLQDTALALTLTATLVNPYPIQATDTIFALSAIASVVSVTYASARDSFTVLSCVASSIQTVVANGADRLGALSASASLTSTTFVTVTDSFFVLVANVVSGENEPVSALITFNNLVSISALQIPYPASGAATLETLSTQANGILSTNASANDLIEVLHAGAALTSMTFVSAADTININVVGSSTSSVFVNGSGQFLPLSTIGASGQVVLAANLGFSRPSIGTYYDINGVVQTAQPNVARFNYAPPSFSTGALLLEQATTNLLFQSGDITTSPWRNSNSPTYVTGQPSPDGGNNAILQAFPSTVSANYDSVQSYNFSVGVTYTLSAYVKDNGNTYITFYMWNAGSGGPDAVFNLVNGTGTFSQYTGNNTSISITSVGNGWYWASMTAVVIPVGVTLNNPFVDFRLCNGPGGGTVSPVVGNGTYIWGPQLEAASSGSSYIPSTAVNGTRAADYEAVLFPFVNIGIGQQIVNTNAINLLSVLTDVATVTSSTNAAVDISFMNLMPVAVITSASVASQTSYVEVIFGGGSLTSNTNANAIDDIGDFTSSAIITSNTNASQIDTFMVLTAVISTLSTNAASGTNVIEILMGNATATSNTDINAVNSVLVINPVVGFLAPIGTTCLVTCLTMSGFGIAGEGTVAFSGNKTLTVLSSSGLMLSSTNGNGTNSFESLGCTASATNPPPFNGLASFAALSAVVFATSSVNSSGTETITLTSNSTAALTTPASLAENVDLSAVVALGSNTNAATLASGFNITAVIRVLSLVGMSATLSLETLLATGHMSSKTNSSAKNSINWFTNGQMSSSEFAQETANINMAVSVQMASTVLVSAITLFASVTNIGVLLQQDPISTAMTILPLTPIGQFGQNCFVTATSNLLTMQANASVSRFTVAFCFANIVTGSNVQLGQLNPIHGLASALIIRPVISMAQLTGGAAIGTIDGLQAVSQMAQQVLVHSVSTIPSITSITVSSSVVSVSAVADIDFFDPSTAVNAVAYTPLAITAVMTLNFQAVGLGHNGFVGALVVCWDDEPVYSPIIRMPAMAQ